MNTEVSIPVACYVCVNGVCLKGNVKTAFPSVGTKPCFSFLFWNKTVFPSRVAKKRSNRHFLVVVPYERVASFMRVVLTKPRSIDVPVNSRKETCLQTTGIPRSDRRDRFQLPSIEPSPDSSVSCIHSHCSETSVEVPPWSLIASL